MGPDPCEDRK